MPAALAAYRVIDLSDSVGGQFCARLFADMGAAVTLVEPPAGSATRRMGPFDRKGRSLQFFHLNFGKQIRALPATGDAMDGLLRAADVVVASDGFDGKRALVFNPDICWSRSRRSATTAHCAIGKGRRSFSRRCRA